MTETAEKTAKPNRTRGRPFRPGESGNPKGRPPGTRNSHDLWEMLERAGDVSPVEFLLTLQNDPKQPMTLRMKAATALLPYVNRQLPAYNSIKVPRLDGPSSIFSPIDEW